MKKCGLLVMLLALASQVAGQKAVPVPANGSAAGAAAEDRSWIARSNAYANSLIAIENKHAPEEASSEGLTQYDEMISQPTIADEKAAYGESKAVVEKLTKQLAVEQNRYVKQDLEIILHSEDLDFRRKEYTDAHVVPYLNASGFVFRGVQKLLDEQTADARRPAAVVRLKKYAGELPGYSPITEILKARTQLQMAKAEVIYPAKASLETSLSRNKLLLDGMESLLKQYQLTGWQETFGRLKKQLTDYDDWVKTALLPKARSDFRQPPELYALGLEAYGIAIAPGQLAEMAHQAFREYQAEMQTIAAQIAKQRGWPSGDYKDVIKRLKQEQLVGEAILPLYQKRLKEIERMIVAERLVTLPDRPARIRIGTPAESAQQPAPHMVPPPLLDNHGEQGEFVLPLAMPAAPGTAVAEKVDDYTFDAAAWTLIAHEARPGHELQFDSMVERGVSLARSRYAFNSTNVEGWGLYAEYITKPYMPLEGQLISLQFRLLRAARAFLDPELQAGRVQPAEAMRILMEECGFSKPFSNQEVERYTLRAPGQANSYFYGYTKLLQLRTDTAAQLGHKFDQKKFHDFILSQGLLPPDLMRKAVAEDFIPAERK
ncbi:MAG TPA: DUF885 domain-containing protein [Candidatus Saccharimonadales bacterium]|nr:DUF885 domain-containing protein [Candidatus Saccharimonadales bacterium]